MNDFTGLFNNNPGIVDQRDPQPGARQHHRPGGAAPLLFRDDRRLGAAGVPDDAGVSDDRRRRLRTSTCSIRTSQCRTPTRGRVGIQRSVGKNMALEVRYVGTRVATTRWATRELQRVQHHRQRLPQRVPAAQANLQANIAAGRGAHVRLHRRAGHVAAADLPRVLQRRSRRRTPATRRSTPAQLDEHDVPRLPGGAQPEPVRLRRTTPPTACRATRRSAATRSPPGCRRTSSSPTRTCIGGANVTTNDGKTRYNALQLELRRRLSQGLQFQTQLRRSARR